MERCLLFKEIWYFAFIKELPPPPLILHQGVHNVDLPLISFSRAKCPHISCEEPSLIWSPVNMAKLFWPIGDRINGVPLY